MPSIENWLQDPLNIIHNVFDNRKSNEWQNQIQEYFKLRLSTDEKILEVPSLNDVPLHNLKPNSLVRFRGMIQDSFEHEYYMDTYEVVNVNDENVKPAIKTSRYQDVVTAPNGFEIKMNSPRNNTQMRQVLYCVSVPGETRWTKQGWGNKSKTSSCVPGTSAIPKKRHHEETETDEMESDVPSAMETSSKRIKSSQNESSTKPENYNLNHPLPDETGPVCIIKVYDENQDFKVNEVMEFIGVLSVDPSLSSTYDKASGDNKENSSEMQSAVDGYEAFEDNSAQYPPASLVPRIHTIMFHKINHLCPSLPRDLSQEQIAETLQNFAPTLRGELISLLQKATLGDIVAAEYLLTHLIARVYTRRDVLAVGSFPLNITGIPPDSNYPKLLAEFLAKLVTKIHYFSMTLENMNTQKFIPAKNYETNRLETGILQLSEGTHLVLDETAMKPGNLDVNGVRHIKALGNLLTSQSVEYNFKFHHVTFPCDINVLVLSEGKSLLPCNCQVKLSPNNGFPDNMAAYFNNLTESLNIEMWDRYRQYLDAARLLNYEVPHDIVNTIEEDFVAARRENSENMTADDLHSHLLLARLLSISVGKQVLSLDVWQRSKMFEAQRKQRLPSSSSSTTNPAPQQNGFS